jgi:superfamily II DNA/RNA helicase
MIQKVLQNLNIAALNEMQQAAIEAAGKPGDIILLSPTGSGKTLGFLLPVLERLEQEKPGVQALVLVPSRELAIQIEQVFKQMSTGYKVSCCYGGHSTRIERNSFEHPPAVLVGTPGRIAYHVRRKSFDPASVHTLVLDEFDKALELGFQEDMSEIIGTLSNVEKRILTSATRMSELSSFAGVKNKIELDFLGKAQAAPAGLKLKTVKAEGKEKLDLLFSLICALGDKAMLVFCNHRDAVERISVLLSGKGLPHGIFHGGMEQEDRERALIKFRNGSHRMLITTDLASRGLDIPEIEAVIHYQLPLTEEAFIHRNGRTARMNAKGTAYLLLADDDHIPEFINERPEQEELPAKNTLPPRTEWDTLYISAGKKDKVNKMDIVGMLLQKGKLQKDELGLIEVLDHSSYAAVKRKKIGEVVQLVRGEKIKNKKVKIEISE